MNPGRPNRAERLARGVALLTMLLALPSPAAPATANSPRITVTLGSGADEVWILPPTGAVRDVVVFAHGWSTPLPSGGFAAWLAHLRGRGSVVVYPRYRVASSESSRAALLAFRAGVAAALRRLRPIQVPILALGKSFGGSAVFYYAAEASAWKVPRPAAVVSIFPAYPVGALPRSPLDARAYVRILVGDADTTAGSGGANAFWAWLAPHAAGLKSYRVVRSRPGFVANHDSAQRSDPIARAVFWQPVDALLTRLIEHHGRY